MSLDGLGSVSWARVAGIVVGGLLVWLAIKYLLVLLRRTLVHDDADLDSEKRALTLIRAVRCAAGVILAAIVLMLLLSEFGISIAPLLGAAGIAGVALGLAAQGPGSKAPGRSTRRSAFACCPVIRRAVSLRQCGLGAQKAISSKA